MTVIRSEHTTNKRKRTGDSFPMSSYTRTSSMFLCPPPAPIASHRREKKSSKREEDDFLSSDLEVSFASTSLDSPPQDCLSLSPESEYPQPMDISPAPQSKPTNMFKSRPRAFTSDSRLFGNNIVNKLQAVQPDPSPNQSSSISNSSSKKMQRAALPMEWLMGPAKPHLFEESLPSAPPRLQPKHESSQHSDDAMDVDTSFSIEHPSPPTHSFPIVPHTAGPTATTFSNLFYDYTSPSRSPAGPYHKKRRSHSPDPTYLSEEASSPGALVESPSQSRLERKASACLLSNFAKPSLQGLGVPSGVKRPRRPALSAMVHTAESMQSAFPILSSAKGSEVHVPTQPPPPRRAFSALISPAINESLLSDDSSFDSAADASSPAQAYAKRQHLKTIRRCDGTEDFRPLTGATAMNTKNSPKVQGSPGLPRFGDNEAHGKILPCHKVTTDGLMRIKPETLDDLLDGVYEDRIHDFHIIDCRFEYEFAGGHIEGAVNISEKALAEELLLGPSLTKPKPSISGDAARKTVLIFHCEFSAQRAPRLATHLRSKDRSMNHAVYPKIHYPEIYILEGGYCQYFKRSRMRCSPQAYISMDDPNHQDSRREDLDKFRKAKFGRHKSYTYGDVREKPSFSAHSAPKRNTVPSGPSSLFAAASAARSRRGGALTTLVEDGLGHYDGDDTDVDIGDSPCPPPNKVVHVKGKRPLTRAETYGPERMPI